MITQRDAGSPNGAAEPNLPVALVCAAPRELANLAAALRGRAQAVGVPNIGALARSLEDDELRVALVVAPLRDETGFVGGVIARAKVRHPGVIALGISKFERENSQELRELALAGIHEYLVPADYASVQRALRVVASGERESVADEVLRNVATILPQGLHGIARATVVNPDKVTDVNGLAGVMRLNRKTISRLCTRFGTPPPAELVSWLRIMLAIHLIDRSGRTPERVALDLNWPSVTSLRNMLKRYTSQTVRQIREQGGLRAVVAAFRLRLGDYGRAVVKPAAAGLPG